MRNASAAFDDGPAFAVAPRKAKARKPRAAGKAGPSVRSKGGKPPSPPLHRVARYAAIGMAGAMALGIMVNALVLQKGHHPAPLFAASHARDQPPAAKPAAPAPARPPRNEAASAGAPAAPLAQPSAPTIPSRAVDEPRHGAAEPHRVDAIGRLLAGEMPAAKAADDRTVSGVQRALTRLGFKVPATGVLGPATRKAIAAFEKNRHMPAKGDIDRRLVKVLAAASGTRID